MLCGELRAALQTWLRSDCVVICSGWWVRIFRAAEQNKNFVLVIKITFAISL